MRKTELSSIASVRSAYPELTPLFHKRKDEEGYSSIGGYFFWTCFYDLLLRRPHRFSSYVASLPQNRQEEAVRAVIDEFDNPKKPGSLFEARLQSAAQEETWKLHGEIRSLKERIRELEKDLENEKAQGKLT